jgi:hypothetical protein
MGDMDSTEQAMRFASQNWLASLENREDPLLLDSLGQLRFEALLSEKLVLTDAQALDGRVFLGLASSGLLHELRPDPEVPVLEIRARRPSLRESAWAMFDARQGGAFRSSFLSNGALVQATTVGGTGTGNKMRSIGDHLVRAGADDAEASALQTGWRAVRGAARQNHVTIALWDATRLWPDMVRMAQSYLPLDHLEDALVDSPESREELRRLSAIEVRSAYRSEIERGGWKVEDREALESWFDERYRRAAAFQHRADYRAIHSGALGRIYARYLALESTHRRTTLIQLPEWFVPQLGRLHSVEWRNLYAVAHHNLQLWWGEGDTSALAQALESFIPRLDPGSSTRRFPKALITLGLALPAPVLALPLQPNAQGVAATLAIMVGEFAIAHAVTSVTRGASIKVTDYLDDVEP